MISKDVPGIYTPPKTGHITSYRCAIKKAALPCCFYLLLKINFYKPSYAIFWDILYLYIYI